MGVDGTLHVCILVKGSPEAQFVLMGEQLRPGLCTGLGLELGSQCEVRGGHCFCVSDTAAVSPAHTGQRGALLGFHWILSK